MHRGAQLVATQRLGECTGACSKPRARRSPAEPDIRRMGISGRGACTKATSSIPAMSGMTTSDIPTIHGKDRVIAGARVYAHQVHAVSLLHMHLVPVALHQPLTTRGVWESISDVRLRVVGVRRALRSS
jgi:hypothetical protein